MEEVPTLEFHLPYEYLEGYMKNSLNPNPIEDLSPRNPKEIT